MPEIIEERDSHLLVLNDEGDTEFIPMSPFNRLLYKHGLFGLLKDQDELWTAADGDEKEWVLIEPLGDHEYHAETHEIETTIKRHEKTELVDYLVEAYKQGDGSPDPQPVINGIMRMRDFDAIPSHVDPLAETPTFDEHVEVQEDGWLINDHVLLTYDNQFKHEHIDTHERSGDDVRPVETDQDAYELRFSYQDAHFSERSGQSADDVEFIARAKWAIDHTAE